MKKIKKLIAIFIIIILILVLLMCFFYKKNVENKNKQEAEEEIEQWSDESQLTQYEDLFEEISDRNDYFVIKNIFDTIVLYVEQINGDMFLDDTRLEKNKEETISELKNSGITFFNNILDENYKNEFNISEEAIISFANKFKQGNSMYDNRNIVYIININQVYGFQTSQKSKIFLINTQINNNKFDCIIKLDLINNTYSLFLDDYVEKYGYVKNMERSNIKISQNQINENDNNVFTYNLINDESMAREYFRLQRNNLLNNIEKEYQLLDEEYSKKRFGSYENFTDYANEIQQNINEAYLVKYQVEHQDNKDIYNLIDSNNQFYSIEVNNSLLDYTVKLDDYTILTDDFKNEYLKLSNNDKVFTNIEMFIKMINSKDYSAAYNVIDNTFKQNNFSDFKEFKNYIKNNFFNNNVLQMTADIEKDGIYYVCKATLVNGENGNDLIEKTFIMALGEELNFSMSFNID